MRGRILHLNIRYPNLLSFSVLLILAADGVADRLKVYVECCLDEAERWPLTDEDVSIPLPQG